MKRLAFSDDMMRALAAGEKTMTRRFEKPAIGSVDHDDKPQRSRLQLGDLVAATCAYAPVKILGGLLTAWNEYRFAPGPTHPRKFKPARVMPSVLAPFVLRITEVRAEKLGKISEADAEREGMLHWWRSLGHPLVDASDAFSEYWCKLYGEHAWDRDSQSWVWVYGFEIAERRTSI